MIFIGVIEATITSPAGALERAQRDLYGRAFLRELAEEVNRRKGELSIEFRLISTKPGCIVCKAAVYLVGAATAGLLIANQVDAARYSKALRGTLNTWFKCDVEQKTWPCQLLKLKLNIGTELHLTIEGDTLESVLRDRFKVKQSELPALMTLTEGWYSHVLMDSATKRLKPGYLIARLTLDMPHPTKALRSSMLH